MPAERATTRPRRRLPRGIGNDLPDHLDLTVEGIVDRIGGINYRIKRMHAETLDELGLTLSDWHVLTALRWAGAPYRRKAGWLARRADLTSGAMTSRLDALEKEGLVRRLRDPRTGEASSSS